MGGVLRQYQILTSPERLAAQDVTLQQLTAAAEKANVIAGGGVLVQPPKESLIRISGQSLSLDQIENTPVVWREPRPVLIKDVADVRFGGPVKRGDGSVRVQGRGRGRRRPGGDPGRPEAARRQHAGTRSRARSGARRIAAGPAGGRRHRAAGVQAGGVHPHGRR